MRVLLRSEPHRSIALATETHVLIFRHSPVTVGSRNNSSASLTDNAAPRCIVEFLPWERADMEDFRTLNSLKVYGTLGLVTLGGDVFLCVVNNATRVATVRPGEDIQRIQSVEFHCLNRGDYDHMLHDQVNPFPGDGLDSDGYDQTHSQPGFEHPAMALKKLLSGGSFYYSADFDVTKRLQDRPDQASSIAIDSLDAGFLWNTYMIQPLVDFRSRLSEHERSALDASRILTSAIRGFALTVTVPPSSSPARVTRIGQPSTMTLISRLSCRRAGTRFNARGIDDDGNVANFVETETVFCTDTLCYSYVQCRGSVPMFWEQSAGLPSQQKINITRSAEATQPAFNKHFQHLTTAYGDVHVVNLLSEEKKSEYNITRQYEEHIRKYSGSEKSANPQSRESDHQHIRAINYDFHVETRGPNGYEAASGIKRYIRDSAVSFEYFLSEETRERPRVGPGEQKTTLVGQNEVLKQAGIFRTNCLDCLDRTNVVQTIISQMAMELFLAQHNEPRPTSDFWARHGMLWADCGDALSMIYAGTGALKSSFTRHGASKPSLWGAIADARKSVQRMYINNFEDSGRQKTIDMLLGRLMGQMPVHLYDPINDFVTAELARRSAEYTSPQSIKIWVGTFNLNGKTTGMHEDLTPWLFPNVDRSLRLPEIVAVAFQEIVELNAQQIVQTDLHRRQQWEEAVRKTLNSKSASLKSEDYVMLRGGQLVGASLSIFVKASVLPYIKNVEGAVKKTGLSGMAGNKGAVAIRMEYADTSICLVTAHLAAGFANYEERNMDYRTISSGLRFQRNMSIEDHKTIIWFGDFNYRIGMHNDRVRPLIDAGDLGALYESDQLNIQMVHGQTFPHYSEKTPTFLPTYKFDLGTDAYDSSEKARIPAWCDRILTKGDNLRQLYYDSAPLRFSDHRPVWGLFDCKVNVVNQAAKDKISAELYVKRRESVGNHPATAKDLLTDDEDLLGYESIGQGLPPASSDKRKWWLDGGMPARSSIKPPSDAHQPNAARPSNPWIPTTEPDWVKVERPSDPPSRNLSIRSSASQTSSSRERAASQPRKLPPPPSDSTAPAKPPRPLLPQNDGLTDDPARTHLKQTLRKPAPPTKPIKPSLLRSHSNNSTTSARSVAAPPPPPAPRRTNNSSTPEPYFPPPPRRRTEAEVPASRTSAPLPPPGRLAGRKAVPGASAGEGYQDAAPSLPPRRPTAQLMDDEGDGDMEMGGWQPLKPQ